VTDSSTAGVGGDWAVRLQVAHADPPPADADPPPAPRRICLIWYVIDGRLGAAQMEALPGGKRKRLGQVRGCVI